jgi:hypothetical protein
MKEYKSFIGCCMSLDQKSFEVKFIKIFSNTTITAKITTLLYSLNNGNLLLMALLPQRTKENWIKYRLKLSIN